MCGPTASGRSRCHSPNREVRLGGIGYDASRQIVYVSQLYADQDGYGYRPMIHALKIGGVAGAPLPSPDSSASTLPPMTPTIGQRDRA